MMDRIVRFFLPDCDDDQRFFAKKNLWFSIPLFALVIPGCCFCLYVVATSILLKFGRIKFSMEPITYTGLDFAQAGAPMPPSFNVTLNAESTYSWYKFCSSGQPTMELMYSGLTIAKTDVQPFCVDAKAEKVVITATLSPGWPALPKVFQERMEVDRRHGGVQMEVDFTFSNDDHDLASDEEVTWWVRCSTRLDANQASRCNSYVVQGC